MKLDDWLIAFIVFVCVIFLYLKVRSEVVIENGRNLYGAALGQM